MNSVAFIYSQTIPSSAYRNFDLVVVEPDHYPTPVDRSVTRRCKIVAYFSVGEIGSYRSYFQDIQQEWILGRNDSWNSYILDLRNSECRNFLLNTVVPMYEQFDGFFLDTLDSYQLVLQQSEFTEYQLAEIELVRKIRERYPDKKILVNRGFEIFNKIRDVIDGVVAESLFYGIDTTTMTYKKMSQEETNYLLPILKQIASSGTKVIVIDYVDPEKKTLMYRICRKIYNNGFIPYVSDMYLQSVGVSTLCAKRRGLKRL